MKFKMVAIFLVLAFLLTGGPGCELSTGSGNVIEPITLEYWRVYDDSDAFEEIIDSYNALHPYITVNYKKLTPEEYETELINALAEDRGPDIFSLQSTWIQNYQKKIAPMPEKTKMIYPIVKGTVKKETINEVREEKSITLKELRERFADTVYKDVVLETTNEKGESQGEKIYGLPLALDTMAMYYNKDLLNNAGIIEPPKYWDKSFQQAVKKLTKQNNKGKIIQSGVALGGSKNIERAEDILSLLMMQNGSVMEDDNGRILFQLIPNKLSHHPGIGALEFYSDFSDPGKEVYCWNEGMLNSLDAFTQGNLAIMFGYAYHLPIIKSRAPKLNFGIAKMPQIENNPIINYPNYWVETVSAKSKHQEVAWNFVQFVNKAENVTKYLKKTLKPTALKSLIEEQINDLDVGVFAEQVITAQSWYHGNDVKKVEEAFEEMINLAAKHELDIEDILKQGASKVQQTIIK